MIYAVLEHSYFEEEVEGEIRKVMRFPCRIAPVQAAIFPLMARDGLDVMAKEITPLSRNRASWLNMMILVQLDGVIAGRTR